MFSNCSLLRHPHLTCASQHDSPAFVSPKTRKRSDVSTKSAAISSRRLAKSARGTSSAVSNKHKPAAAAFFFCTLRFVVRRSPALQRRFDRFRARWRPATRPCVSRALSVSFAANVSRFHISQLFLFRVFDFIGLIVARRSDET
ncbi:hypothetical protein L596_022170 [Steinernema carpocapsae]|uniref:Uncharacterized protein n=1 Tax=Steinernema carpocapsae TaxID=34508 RepID=A0A4U5MKX6_STECR|nr:hypothetical protein L596_022170 [Steinernema carpocapsae]